LRLFGSIRLMNPPSQVVLVPTEESSMDFALV